MENRILSVREYLQFVNFSFLNRCLTGFAVNLGIDGVKCLLECNGGVAAFTHPMEALDICREILKVSADRPYV